MVENLSPVMEAATFSFIVMAFEIGWSLSSADTCWRIVAVSGAALFELRTITLKESDGF